MAPPKINSFSHIIVQKICTNLDAIDLINCRRISPMFRKVTADHLRRRFRTFKFTNNYNHLSYGLVFQYIGPSLRHLIVDTNSPRIHQNLHLIIKMCPVLDTLEYVATRLNRFKLTRILPELQTLKSLIISGDNSNECAEKWLPACSTTLIHFRSDYTSDVCLASAPTSLRKLELGNANISMKSLCKYLKSNPDLVEFEIDYSCLDIDLDLASLCVHLCNLDKLTLITSEKSSVKNYEELSKLYKLATLDIIANDDGFFRYPFTYRCNQHLSELRLTLTGDLIITPKIAKSFECFTNLNRFALICNYTDFEQDINIVLPHLGKLDKLDYVQLNGDTQYDLEIVCKHLTQISSLDISVDDIYNPKCLVRLENLNDLRVNIKFGSDSLHEIFVNRLLLTMAKTNRIKCLHIEAFTFVTLYQTTIAAMNTFSLEYLLLRNTINGEEIIPLVRNLSMLTTFEQYEPYTQEVRESLMSIRPGKLRIIMDDYEEDCIDSD